MATNTKPNEDEHNALFKQILNKIKSRCVRLIPILIRLERVSFEFDLRYLIDTINSYEVFQAFTIKEYDHLTQEDLMIFKGVIQRIIQQNNNNNDYNNNNNNNNNNDYNNNNNNNSKAMKKKRKPQTPETKAKKKVSRVNNNFLITRFVELCLYANFRLRNCAQVILYSFHAHFMHISFTFHATLRTSNFN